MVWFVADVFVHTVYRSDGLRVRVVHTTGLTTHVFVVDPGSGKRHRGCSTHHAVGTLSRSLFLVLRDRERPTPPGARARRARRDGTLALGSSTTPA